MVIRKTRKIRKFRGKRNYGYGVHKKHRGGGSRGGRGKSGAHKHKWSYTVKYEPWRFGKRGFKRSHITTKIKAINVGLLEKLAIDKKKINLTEFGYNKVLGSGKINVALEVTSEQFSKKAVEKIEAAGGKVVVVGKVEEKTKEDKDED